MYIVFVTTQTWLPPIPGAIWRHKQKTILVVYLQKALEFHGAKIEYSDLCKARQSLVGAQKFNACLQNPWNIIIQNYSIAQSVSDSLRPERSRYRIPVGEIFSSSPSRPGLGLTQTLVHWETGFFTGGKSAEAQHWPQFPSGTEVTERVELHLYSPFGPSWPVPGWNVTLKTSVYDVRINDGLTERSAIGRRVFHVALI
jgi:hypothetical protein